MLPLLPFLQYIPEDIETLGEFTDWFGGWGAFVVISMLIVLFFYSIVHSISYVIRSEELKRTARAHFIDSFFTVSLAMLVISVLSAFFTLYNEHLGGYQVTCSIYGNIILNKGAGPFDVIKCRLMEKASYVSDIYERAYYESREPFRKLTMMWGLLGLPVYMYGQYITQTGISQVYTQVEQYRLLTHVCVSLLIGINSYISAVNYIYMNMMRMFLPIGIVLRAIPFTRGIGAFFMAVAVGFYVIFPYIFVMTDPQITNVQMPYVDITDTSTILFPWPSFQGAVSIATMGPQFDTSSQIFGAASLKSLAADLAKLYYGLILQPVVVLGVTLIFVRYFTSLFGGESQELYRLASKVI